MTQNTYSYYCICVFKVSLMTTMFVLVFRMVCLPMHGGICLFKVLMMIAMFVSLYHRICLYTQGGLLKKFNKYPIKETMLITLFDGC
jgi:hypothetical protein